MYKKYKIAIEFNSSEIMPLLDSESQDSSEMERWAAIYDIRKKGSIGEKTHQRLSEKGYPRSCTSFCFEE